MVYNDLDYLGKNEEEDGEEGQGQPVSPVSSGQPGAVNPAAPSQGAQPERKGSGKFTNIKKYVDANTSASQKLGQGIQQKIGSEAENVRKGIESAQNQFQQGAQQTEGILNKATGYAQQVGQVGGAQQIANVEPEFKTFRDIYTGQVKGPDETISSQRESTAKLQALSQLAGNEAGRFQLLDDTYAKPTQQYTKGQKRFDQLLLQGTPDVTKNIQEFGKQQAGDVQQKFGATEKAQQAEVQRLMDLGLTQKQALDKATGRTFGEEDTGAFGGAYKELTEAQQAAKLKQEQDVASIQEALKKYGQPASPKLGGTPSYLTTEQAKLLNLDPNLRTYGLDLAQFAPELRVSDTDITKADIANQEQQARLNALYQLTGQDPSGLNLGEKYGRQGAEFGQDFEGARQAQLEKLIQEKYGTLGSRVTSYNPKTGTQVYDPFTSAVDYGGQAGLGLLNYGEVSNYFNENINPMMKELTRVALTGEDISPSLNQYQNSLNQYAGFLGNDFRNQLAGTEGGSGMRTIRSLYSSQLPGISDQIRKYSEGLSGKSFNIQDLLALGAPTLTGARPSDPEDEEQ